MARLSISYADQCKSLTTIRQQDPAYLAVNAQSAQVTLKRLDLAFKAFFRRAAAGKEPGLPCFKAKDRFPGFGFKTHGDGFRFTPGKGWCHGQLRLSGVGDALAAGPFARKPWLSVRIGAAAGSRQHGTRRRRCDACGRSETNRSGTDLGSRKRA